jgi:hypothetical protein
MSSPAEDLARVLGVAPAEPTTEPDPVAPPQPRRPRPDPSQGSGSNGPTALPASSQFADWITRLPLGNGTGNWHKLDR